VSYKKLGYFIVGWISLALGVLGIVLPLLPTTPFVLLSAFCFSKSSKRFHDWLLNHKVFGPLVKDWQRHGVIKIQAKILASVSMLLMVSLSLYFVSIPWIYVFAILLMISGVLVFIWTRPSYPQELNK
jgi:uncharacterized membrane protein YbaN (DUF454 family)